MYIMHYCRLPAIFSGACFWLLATGKILYQEHVDVENLLANATIISCKAQKYANEKKELKDEINNIVSSDGASATLDVWTDKYVRRNFLGVTFYQNY